MSDQKTLDFHASLGVGLDVDWCKNQTDRRFYSRAMEAGISFPAMLKQKGFGHARIRVKDYELTQVFEGTGDLLVNEITDRVVECNDVGLVPIVAFQAETWKENPTSSIERDRVAGWWQMMAVALKGLHCGFNVLIETTLIGKNNDAALNQLYRECVAAIRGIDPDRICIVCRSIRPTHK